MKRRDSITLNRDAATARNKDENGFLHVLDNPVTREQVAEYWGSEIPGHEELGLEAGKVYRMYRPGEELEKAAASINRLPIYLRHQSVDSQHPEKDGAISAIKIFQFKCLFHIYAPSNLFTPLNVHNPAR